MNSVNSAARQLHRFAEKPIREAMSRFGFTPKRHLTYRYLSDSAEVRHFVYFSRWGNKNEYLTAIYGFGNLGADNFAVQCLKKYGGSVYREWELDRSNNAVTRLSLGRLAGWDPRDSILWRTITDQALTQQIAASIQLHVVPVIARLQTKRELLDVLISDSESCPWVLTNAAARAAQIAYLLALAGTEIRQSRETLLPYAKNIGAQLTSALSASAYIEKIIDEACSLDLAVEQSL